MSCQPRCSHSWRRCRPSARSPKRSAERLGVDGVVGDRGHGDSPGRRNFSARPRRRSRSHSRSPAGSRRVTRKYHPKRSHSCGSSRRRAALREDVTPVAVGEEPLRRIVGVLRVHATAEDRFELVGAVRVQVDRVEASAERQAAAHQPAVDLHLVAADEQPQIGHADGLQRGRAEQRTVEQRRDARQKILPGHRVAQFADVPPPHQSSAQRKGKACRIIQVAHHR